MKDTAVLFPSFHLLLSFFSCLSHINGVGVGF